MALTPSSTAQIRDQVIHDAQSLPDLISRAKVLDPDLAAQLTGKALIASKSIWGNAIALVVSWAVTRFALGWDDNTCALVTGLIVMAMTVGMRAITAQPINGVLKTGGS
jgi:hypothetical protein